MLQFTIAKRSDNRIMTYISQLQGSSQKLNEIEETTQLSNKLILNDPSPI